MKHLTAKHGFILIVFALIATSIIILSTTSTKVSGSPKILSIEEVPAIIYERYEAQKDQVGFSINTYDNSTYLLITMGQLPRTGYSILIRDISSRYDNWTVKAHFIKPTPRPNPVMDVTYPASVVKLPITATKVKVIMDDKPLTQIN